MAQAITVNVLTGEQTIEEYTPEPYIAPAPLPLIVSPRQIRQALNQVNLRTQVEQAVAASDQNTKDWWEFATQFEENHPQIAAMTPMLSMTGEQVHSIFTLASTL